jgi:hypothetical protein
MSGLKLLLMSFPDFGLKHLQSGGHFGYVAGSLYVDESKRNHGFIDVLVNNAGVAQQKLLRR